MVFIVFRYQPKLIIIKYFREIYDSKNEKKIFKMEIYSPCSKYFSGAFGL